MAPVIRKNGNPDEYIVNRSHPQFKFMVTMIPILILIISAIFGLGGNWFYVKTTVSTTERLLPEIQKQLIIQSSKNEQIDANTKCLDNLEINYYTLDNRVTKVETRQEAIREKIK